MISCQQLESLEAMATILLVEDEEPIRQFIGELLEGEGYDVVMADHGAQALGLVQSARPTLVVTDLMMPIMSGAELCRWLKGDAATQSVPVIVMSAADRAQANGCGADAFLKKPFELDALLELVERYADGPAEPGAGGADAAGS
jgi:CheY-like chemotaxis protein